MLNVETICDLITRFISDTYHEHEYIIYGSFARYKEGYFEDPLDIDITIPVYSDAVPDPVEVCVFGIPIPLNITFQKKDSIDNDVSNLEPKFFHVIYPLGTYHYI